LARAHLMHHYLIHLAAPFQVATLMAALPPLGRSLCLRKLFGRGLKPSDDGGLLLLQLFFLN
jgi:hypothetical protein